jgi:hypothetical protein
MRGKEGNTKVVPMKDKNNSNYNIKLKKRNVDLVTDPENVVAIPSGSSGSGSGVGTMDSLGADEEYEAAGPVSIQDRMMSYAASVLEGIELRDSINYLLGQAKFDVTISVSQLNMNIFFYINCSLFFCFYAFNLLFYS